MFVYIFLWNANHSPDHRHCIHHRHIVVCVFNPNSPGRNPHPEVNAEVSCCVSWKIINVPSIQTVPCIPPKPSSSTPDQSPPSEDQSQADDGTTKCVVQGGGWHNAASRGIVVRRWIAIRFRWGGVFWGEFLRALWGELHVCWWWVGFLFILVYNRDQWQWLDGYSRSKI